jgi:hypothetical protein
VTIDAGRQGRRTTYPNIPEVNWWALRRRFQQTMPREIDSSYLATVLNISEPAAGNLTGPLRTVGLIDETGRPTDLALAWRDDEQYQQVTAAILAAVYPQGLRDAAPPPSPDRGAVVRWFSRTTGAGQAATERMARLYLLLAAGDPTAADQPSTDRSAQPGSAPLGRPSRRTRETSRPGSSARTVATPEPSPTPAPSPVSRQAQQPSLHIDIQVHIDPAATPEQIDQIFASMARHLYDRE